MSDAYPSHIRLTANGIDLVDEITNQIIENMKRSTEDQQEMKTIVNEDNQIMKREKWGNMSMDCFFAS